MLVRCNVQSLLFTALAVSNIAVPMHVFEPVDASPVNVSVGAQHTPSTQVQLKSWAWEFRDR